MLPYTGFEGDSRNSELFGQAFGGGGVGWTGWRRESTRGLGDGEKGMTEIELRAGKSIELMEARVWIERATYRRGNPDLGKEAFLCTVVRPAVTRRGAEIGLVRIRR